MGKIVTLEYVKKHSRIEYDMEDDLLEEYIESSEQTVLNIMNRDIESLLSEYGSIPADIRHAVLMLVDHSYLNRSPVLPQALYAIPYSIDAKLKPYMIL